MRYLIVIILFFTSTSFATEVINTMTQNTISQNTAITSSILGKPSDWSLNESEWKHYLSLMEGPNGRYYPALTPIEILGINATNLEDLKHFAELAAKQEHAKIERELRFNAAFQEAAKRLYAEEPIIRPFDISPYSPVSK